MSELPAFTDEQQQAIARRSGPLALAASAGSGKTSVLVERYVRAVHRGRHRPVADPRDHLHRPRGRRAARAGPAAAWRRGRARGRARERRARSCRPSTASAHGCCARMRCSSGWRPTSACSATPQAADAARCGVRPGARRDGSTIDGGARARRGVRRVRAARRDRLGLRRAAQPRRASAGARRSRPRDTTRPRPRRRSSRAARELAAELAAAPRAKTIDRALEALAAAAELAGGPVAPSPLRIAELALRNGASALVSAAGERYEAARTVYRGGLRGPARRRRGGPPGRTARGVRAALRVAASAAAACVDFDDLELEAGALLAEHEEIRDAVVRSLRAPDGRRAPGHQRAPDGDARDPRPRQPVHRRRRVPVDLRLPPRRRRAVPRAACAARRRPAPRACCRRTSAHARRCSRPSTRSSAPRFGERFVPLIAGRAGRAARRIGAARRAARRRHRRLGAPRASGSASSWRRRRCGGAPRRACWPAAWIS